MYKKYEKVKKAVKKKKKSINAERKAIFLFIHLFMLSYQSLT